jgi:ribose/xylose/arabinose/galactoside ABC-type transport system permease subunit
MNPKVPSLLSWIVEQRIYVILVVLFLLAFFFVPYFATLLNLANLAVQLSIDGVIVVGMAILMIAYGIDLGVGANFAMSGIVYALLAQKGIPIPLAALGGVITGSLVGLANGLIVTKLKIHFFIATLATMVIVQGIAITISKGEVVYPGVQNFDWLGRHQIGPVEFPVIAFLIMVVIGHFILSQTKIGRYWYAIGDNPEAAKRAGLNVDRIFIYAFIAVGLCAGLSGVIFAGRANSGSPSLGVDTALNVISASVVGGISLYGGIGSIPGAFAGLLIINILRNSLNLLGVTPYTQYVVRGLILISVVVMDAYFNWRKRSV